MRLEPDTKIHLACAPVGQRYGMDFVMLRADVNPPRLEATDGRILAVVPVEFDDDEEATSALIPAADLAEVYKGRTSEARSLSSNGHVTLRRGPITLTSGGATSDTAPFPRTQAILDGSEEPAVTVRLDVSLLQRLAKAIGAEAVTLRIPANSERGCVTKPIKVEGDKGYGAIMPILEDFEG